jgi:hypothetical protein
MAGVGSRLSPESGLVVTQPGPPAPGGAERIGALVYVRVDSLVVRGEAAPRYICGPTTFEL